MTTRRGSWDQSAGFQEQDQLSARSYVLLLTAFTLAGMIFAGFMATVSYHWTWTYQSFWPTLAFCAAVAISAICGAQLAEKSDNPAVSLLGYALVAGPFGLLLGPYVSHFTGASIIRVLTMTIIMVLILGFIGAVIPQSLEHWAGWLIGGTLALIGAYFLMPLLALAGVPLDGVMTLVDWAGVALFALWTIYDLNKAMRLERTLDKAIDSACTIFVDVVNLFIRLLSLFGDSSLKPPLLNLGAPREPHAGRSLVH